MDQLFSPVTAIVVMFAPLVAVVTIICTLVLIDMYRDYRRRRRSDRIGDDIFKPDEADITRWVTHCLRETDLFEGLTDAELAEVVGIGTWQPVGAGERLGEAGSEGHEVYSILRGQLRLLSPRSDGEMAVRVAHENETIPLAALMAPPSLVTAIEAAADGDVFVIPRDDLLALCDREPAIGLQIFRATTKAFERRYRATVEGLVPALSSALHLSGRRPVALQA
ncbi:MAG: Crp/Fnr family transcriptional regulator [Dehalococcoidia bacterium]